jgi:alpha-L-fucosidase
MVRKGETINTVMLQEDISKGQRVESFRVEGWIEEEWITLAEGTTIGYKRLLRFGDVAPERIKVTIQGTRDIANIIKVGAYDASPLKDNHKEFRLNEEPI